VTVANVDLSTKPPVGVGLRHPHYEAALSRAADIDFVEVHTENFFGEGGASLAVLEQAREHYELSFHCTALGLGSAAGISTQAVARLAQLVARFNPMLVSDHLCFCWVQQGDTRIHAGDLLPLPRNADALAVLTDNIDRVQQALGRSLVVENISTYIDQGGHQWSEPEFLLRLVERTGCQLLVDINNLLVNAHNAGLPAAEDYARAWLDAIPRSAVAEIHLAGYTPVAPGQLAVDDHAAPVSEQAWRIYAHALQRLGNVPTLVEWDNDLPDWSVLLAEATRAREIQRALQAAEA
tara:strand:+ start:5181 stop:6062 length:882 start_codon:yes stop_codon:yes gene_type:complete